MLDWLTGPDSGEPRDNEPETPAHIFAARAFKSALFGTPAPPRDDEVDTQDFALKLALGKVNASPAKGILLTPGTVGTKRKSVSFGVTNLTKVSEENGGDVEDASKAIDKPVPASGPAEAKDGNSRPIRRSLFNRPKPFQPRTQTQNTAKTESIDQRSSEVIAEAQQGGSADVTVDLEQPRSISGRHWMKEYQRDHALSKMEMKKLIKYSQTAKLHAAKRDREVIRLKGKLEKSESRTNELERDVAELRRNGTTRPEDTEKSEKPRNESKEKLVPESDLSRLRKAAGEASDKAARLERENESFRKTIVRVKQEMAKYESRHKEWLEQRRRKDERNTTQRKALKERVISYRTQLQTEFDAFQEKAEKDKAALLREIDFLRGELSAASPEKSDLLTSGEPLRQLLARVHEQPQNGERKLQPSPKKRRPGLSSAKEPLQRLKDEWQDVEETSSPTILEGHLRRASKKSSDYSPAASRISVAPPHRDKADPLSPRPTMIAYSPAKPLNEDVDSLPVIMKRRDISGRAPKATKAVRVKSKHGFAGKIGAASTQSGLTPEREAAARLRIAQRSAEKQRSTKFLFEEEREKENRNILRERPTNRLG